MSCREVEEAAAEVKARERRASAALLKEEEGLGGAEVGGSSWRQRPGPHARLTFHDRGTLPICQSRGEERPSKQEVCFRWWKVESKSSRRFC